MGRRRASICIQCMQLLRQPASRSTRAYALPTLQQDVQRRLSHYAPTSTQLARRRDVYSAGYGRNVHGAGHGRDRRAAPAQAHAQARFASTSSSQPDLRALHTRVGELSSIALHPDDSKTPSEQGVLYVLEQFDAMVHRLLDIHAISVPPPDLSNASAEKTPDTSSATSALLGSVYSRQSRGPLSKTSLLTLISQTATQILHSPQAPLTPAILHAYVELQSHLSNPAPFPDMFAIYATKPSTPNSRPRNPNSPSAAIPPATANLALEAAVAAKNLPLAIEIIQTTFATPAHHRAKLIRQTLLPGTILLTSPILAYGAALRFSDWQTTMSASHATGIAFAGFLTYIATITGLAYVVITTANDQMERVTWARGVPLWERWVREEERRAWDAVAMGWGFRDVGRRGEEEGEEWERLREEIGERGMVLDAVGLMEGME